jgi:hypothetical protein
VVDLRGRVLAGSGSGYSALLCLGEVGQGKGDGTRVVWAFFFSFTYIGEGDLFSTNTLFVTSAMFTKQSRIFRIHTICAVLPRDKSVAEFPLLRCDQART